MFFSLYCIQYVNAPSNSSRFFRHVICNLSQLMLIDSTHFMLPPVLYQVLSVTLDDWSDSDIDSMLEVGGNSYANSIYEAFLPKDHPKPKPDSTMEYRTKFIRSGSCFISHSTISPMFSHTVIPSLFYTQSQV